MDAKDEVFSRSILYYLARHDWSSYRSKVASDDCGKHICISHVQEHTMSNAPNELFSIRRYGKTTNTIFLILRDIFRKGRVSGVH